MEWIHTWPDWLQNFWFAYVTFHDLVQWAVMLFLARTAWGTRKKKRELEEILIHVHEELHHHVLEDYHRPRIIKRERLENGVSLPG